MILLLLLLLFPCVANATVWYVRSDGAAYGTTSTTCNGLYDVAYSAGNGPNCAVSHPFYITGVDANCGGAASKLAAGDTLIIAPKTGGYDMGYGASNTSGSSSYPWDCHMRPITSGSSSSNKTKIYGSNYGNCSTIDQATELYGKERSYWVLDLQGSDNVDIQCLNITDHSECRYNSPINDGDACSSSYPYGDFAQRGLKSSGSDYINLKDIWIHGIAAEGMSISTPSYWTTDNLNVWANTGINVNFNGTGAGGTTDAATGTMTFNRGIIAWGGCTEKYPVSSSSYDGITLYDPKMCCSQDQGCTSDGIGTNSNGASWILNNVTFTRNVADGLDLLYVDQSGGSVTLSNVKSIKNSGNQIKTSGIALINNPIVDGDCGYFSGKSYTWEYSGNCGTWNFTNQSTCETGHAGCEWNSGDSKCYNFSDHCRAGGDAFSNTFQAGTSVRIRGATLVNLTGNSAFNISARNHSSTTCQSDNILDVKNMVANASTAYLGGTPQWINIDSSCSSSTRTYAYSNIYNFSSNPTGTGNVFTNTNLSGTIAGTDQNVYLSLTSPANGIADSTATGALSTDFNNYPRTVPWDAGALEYGSEPTTVSISKSISGSFRLSGSLKVN